MPTSSQSYPMNGGDGEHSYIHNSLYQKAAIDGAEEKTRRCILEKLDLLNRKHNLCTFRIADFGCSTGPNTFHAVQNIIETVKLKYKKNNKESCLKSLEFQVFLNDQTNNDFNTLFRTNARGTDPRSPSSESEYFLVGVPGSFYGRVLPKNSIHIGHTSYTTHWLSKTPDKKSLALNNNYIQCNNMIEEVTKAYKIQFIEDMRVFLEARSEEIVHGGLMIILGQCLPDDVSMFETWQGVVVDTIGDCLMDMTKSGVTTMEKIELFNLPVYFPKYSELKSEIENNKSFKLEKMEITNHPLEDITLSHKFITSMFRAILYTVLKEHFGEDVVNDLFDRLAKKISMIDFNMCEKHVNYFIMLKRK